MRDMKKPDARGCISGIRIHPGNSAFLSKGSEVFRFIPLGELASRDLIFLIIIDQYKRKKDLSTQTSTKYRVLLGQGSKKLQSIRVDCDSERIKF